MNNPSPEALPLLCFSEIYEQNIEAKLKAIDIFLKTTTPPYSSSEVTNLLHITLEDLEDIMSKNHIPFLNMVGFFSIMQTASSYICRLLQREWECSISNHYTPEAISYIYELNPEKVKAAFKQSGITTVTSHNIKELFSYIYVPVMNFKI